MGSGRAAAGARWPAGVRRQADRPRNADAGALSESVSLDTHIRDVVALLQRHDLRDVVLVGHSYGGMIITGAAEHARDRIGHLVYVDALVPEHGQSALDIMTDRDRPIRLGSMADAGGGWRMRPSATARREVGAGRGPRARVRRGTAVRFHHALLRAAARGCRASAAALPRTYIASVKEDYPAKVVFEPFAARARREGWGYHELPTGHDCQAEMPDDVTELLLKAAVESKIRP